MPSVMRLCLSTALAACLAGAASAQAELTPEQREQIASLEKTFKKAATLYRGKKFEEFAQLVSEARQATDGLASTGSQLELVPLLAPLEKKLAAAERLLKARQGGAAGAGFKPVGGEVSFTKGVLPILVAKCGNCHIRNRRRGFSMATFADLKKGSDDGIVFTAGKSQGSRFIEVMETGDMPRGGAKITPDELTLIARWIDAGAKFDGRDETVPLATLAPAAPERPMLEVVAASGDEAVQFVRDLAPVVVANCLDCHAGDQPSGRLNLDTFVTMLRGGQSGVIIEPGKPAESLLVRKLRGASGDQMPLRRPPLDEAVIRQFEAWIAAGAKFDWPDPAQPLDLAVRIMVATKMTHDELAVMRAGLAQQNWRLALPDAPPETLEADDFLLVGNLTPARMQELAELAKGQQAKVVSMLKIPAGEPYLKGKLTLFAFNRRFDYSEFGTMVEKRELPSQWLGHWRYNVVDAYACVVAPSIDAPSLRLLLGQQFAGAYLESRGDVPRWFAVGSAMVVASRLEPRDPLVHMWDEGVKAALVTSNGPDDFLKGGDVLTGNAAALSYGFLKGLMSKMPKYLAFVEEVRAGAAFEAAFKKHYGGDPATVATAWGRG